MIKVAVCDDIIEVGKRLKMLIEDYNFVDDVGVDVFTMGGDLYDNAIEKRYDIIFMDIELAHDDESLENGMELSNRIKMVYPEVLIVFITGFPVNKNDLLNFEPFRFIEKPIQDEEVIEAMETGIKRVKGWEDKFFRYKLNGLLWQINIKHILYFSSRRPYIEIHSINELIEFRGKMDNVEKQIAEMSVDFIRVNKSCLVNTNFIRSVSSRDVVLTNGERIGVGRKYIKNLLDK